MAKTRPSLTRPSVSRLSVRLKNKTFGTSSSKKNARCRPSNLDDVHADPTFLLFAGSFMDINIIIYLDWTSKNKGAHT